MSDQCREWTGSTTAKGYGRVYAGGGKYMLVHHLAWIAANGAIPEGLMILHYCDNPPCYRLDHLRLGTHADNMSDRKLAGHYKGLFGEDNGASKLTTSDVLEIRRLYEAEQGRLTQQQLAERFGITQPQVSDIVRRVRWNHV